MYFGYKMLAVKLVFSCNYRMQFNTCMHIFCWILWANKINNLFLSVKSVILCSFYKSTWSKVHSKKKLSQLKILSQPASADFWDFVYTTKSWESPTKISWQNSKSAEARCLKMLSWLNFFFFTVYLFLFLARVTKTVWFPTFCLLVCSVQERQSNNMRVSKW